ncbi:RICIN domain-containing protein [Streptomyces sp. NPDC060048]|uniref:RICIN domain-containing protein n=1 Tax=unclassified Streptomyces TaxID=2593676 RepID=UPI003686F8D7
MTGPAYQGVQNQSFQFKLGLGPGGFTYRIENVYSGMVLSMNANGSVTVQPSGTSNDQHFSLVNQADGSVGIRGAHNGLVLDMSSAGTVTGRAYAGNTNQSFNLFTKVTVRQASAASTTGSAPDQAALPAAPDGDRHGPAPPRRHHGEPGGPAADRSPRRGPGRPSACPSPGRTRLCVWDGISATSLQPPAPV